MSRIFSASTRTYHLPTASTFDLLTLLLSSWPLGTAVLRSRASFHSNALSYGIEQSHACVTAAFKHLLVWTCTRDQEEVGQNCDVVTVWGHTPKVQARGICERIPAALEIALINAVYRSTSVSEHHSLHRERSRAFSFPVLNA